MRNKTVDPLENPKFWDALSKVQLSPAALKELDKRNKLRPETQPKFLELRGKACVDLAYFARHGGPDLGHLRAV